MQPHEIAAHRIADAYEQIANEMAHIDQTALLLMLPGVKPWDVPAMQQHYRDKAERIRATVPFVPCTEHELALMNAQVVEEYADQSTRDMVRDHFDRPDWQLRAEWDDRCEWDEMEAHNDN